MNFSVITKKVICVVVLSLILNMVFITPVNALSDMVQSAQNFLLVGDNPEYVINTENLQTTSDFIFNAFLIVAIVVAVGVGIVLGVKFITESAEGQAKVKEALVPYIVGCIVIFAAFPIWSFIVNAGQDAAKMSLEYTDDGEIKYIYTCPYCREQKYSTYERIYEGREEDDDKIWIYRCNCGARYELNLTNFEVKLLNTPYKYCYQCGREEDTRERDGRCYLCYKNMFLGFKYCRTCGIKVDSRANESEKLCIHCSNKIY